MQPKGTEEEMRKDVDDRAKRSELAQGLQGYPLFWLGKALREIL